MIPDEEVKLTAMSPAAGCAAKIGSGTLAGILKKLPHFEDSNLLVGIETSDDGAVYRISEELLGEILKSGADKVKEAGSVLAGGHSIQDDVPKYGLSVTGLVHPDKLYKNCGARPGDVLVLTKPLGTGIINTAVKAGMASKEAEAESIRVMTTLNKRAKEILDAFDVHSCTDVTGFGLAGHAMEMAEELLDVVFDPQTSGGLLVSVSAEDAEKIQRVAETEGVSAATSYYRLDTAAKIVADAISYMGNHSFAR